MNVAPAQPPPDAPATAPYRTLAKRVGVGYLDTVSPDRLLLQEADAMALLQRPDPIAIAYLDRLYGRPTFLVGPSRGGLERLPKLQAQSPLVRSRFRIIPFVELRKAIISRVSGTLTRNAVHGLFDAYPEFSARTVVTTPQAILVTAAVMLIGLLAAAYPELLLDAVRIVATFVFFGCTLLRCLAALQSDGDNQDAPGKPEGPEPTYSILVPLRHEAAIVPQLLTALSRIVWPRERLEIKLICEADDFDTIAAIRTHQLRDYVELIEVPPSQPRTKPKALRYALQATTGEYIVLYDAEDIPHPMQLQQAWSCFAAAGPELACLQAPLDITNGKASWISALFAFEYAGLFRCLLPWLATRRSVMPLGGTSNHFRRAALEDVGAWDPHNVTEDADLGLRFARFGYRCDMMALPTTEEGPETLAVWRPQRTRWCKGWLQTWLVHMRRPPQLARELGMRSFLLSQLLLFGIVFSAMVHPLLLVTATWFLWSLAAGVVLSNWSVAFFCMDVFNILCSYGGFLAVGAIGEKRLRRKTPRRVLAMTPVYWLMMSLAAWIAVLDLIWRPFHWAKTPHKPMRRLTTFRTPGLA